MGKQKKRPLNRQNGRSSGFSCFELPMSLSRVFEGETLLDLDLHLAARHDLEQLVRRSLKLGARRIVVKKRWAGQEQRALLREDTRRKRIDRARRIAEADHHPARSQAIQRLHEGIAAD